jgi:hypothetical protein
MCPRILAIVSLILLWIEFLPRFCLSDLSDSCGFIACIFDSRFRSHTHFTMHDYLLIKFVVSFIFGTRSAIPHALFSILINSLMNINQIEGNGVRLTVCDADCDDIPSDIVSHSVRGTDGVMYTAGSFYSMIDDSDSDRREWTVKSHYYIVKAEII